MPIHDTQQLVIHVPTEHLGDVAGKLTALGAWIDSLEPTEAVAQSRLVARVPIQYHADLIDWLGTIPGSQVYE